MNISCHSGFIAVSWRGKKTYIVAKNRRTVPPESNILKSDNMRRTFYQSKKTKNTLKNITATETIMLNNGKIKTSRIMR